MNNKFNAGDRVIYVGTNYKKCIGKTGVIIRRDPRINDMYAVKFDGNIDGAVDFKTLAAVNLKRLLSSRLIERIRQ